MYPYWLANEAVAPNTELEVRDKYSGEVAARVAMADRGAIDAAIAAAVGAAEPMRAMAAYERQAVLEHCVRRFQERSDDLAMSLCIEAGKPIRDSRGEVTRLIDTFRIAAEEAPRIYGEVLPMDVSPRARGYAGMWKRVPLGPCSFISPFNFPLNLAAHKVAPALAVGAPVVLKPAPKTPLSGLLLGELVAATDLPAGMLSVLNVPDDRAGDLVADPRLPVVSFTGSGPVGYAIQRQVPGKHVVLELGGNAAVVVCDDWSSDTDLEWAATRIANFSNYQAGQSCIGVQRVYVDRSVHDRLRDLVVAKVAALATGDPRDPDTFVGPMINEDAAVRVEQWVAEAVAAGAEVLTGGGRVGAAYAPTVLAGVPRDAKLTTEEVFGPVLVLEPVDSLDEAFAAVNASRFGLQAGVFTHSLQTAFRAHRDLEVGGVVVGDAPSYRADQMPYGGVKESGVGREGVRYAMSDFTYERVMVLTGLDL
jgi:aldehyde dehydrogenase (NAD+)